MLDQKRALLSSIYKDTDRIALADVEKVKTLILYTGGTFGMWKTKEGYDVKKGYLFDKLSKNDDFNSTPNETFKYEGFDTFLTPQTLQKKQVQVSFFEFPTLIDSS